MSKPKRWTTIRKNISKLLHISPDILDFLSNYDIMLASVSGSSNKDISKSLDIEEKEVRKVIHDYIGYYCGGWDGFRESSEINPYFVFKSIMKQWSRINPEEEFIDEMQRLTGDAGFLGESYEKIFGILVTFSKIRYKFLSRYRKEDNGNYSRRNPQEITRL